MTTHPRVNLASGWCLVAACLAIGVVGCRGHDHRPHANLATTRGSVATTGGGTGTPCHRDSDCRLVDCAGCTCGGVHVKDPDGCERSRCVAWPCAGYVAVCDATTHRCRSEKSSGPDASRTP